LFKAEKTTWEHPLHVWRTAGKEKNIAAAWQKLAKGFGAEARRRTEFNARNYVSFGDFRAGRLAGWRASGQGLRHGPGAAGDFTVSPAGNRLVGSILPAGLFTHGFSAKLNGALRSPLLPTDKKRISFHVIGQKQAAVRIVSNNCQLNYRELMTKFDNPKYPDQLGTLGGDDGNQRVPWDRAADDPHSYFGVTHVVLHDVKQPPHDALTWLGPLLAGSPPADRAELAARTLARLVVAARPVAQRRTAGCSDPQAGA
jgi:hypothetical protein